MPTTGELDTTKPLPAKVEEAARIEALEGLSLEEISKRVGLTRQTLSNYKNHHPRYLELRMETAKEITEPFEIQRSLASMEVITGLRKAVGVTTRLLDYEVDGLPQTAVQLEAVRMMAVLTKTVLGSMGAAEEKTCAQAVAAVVIKFEGKESDIAIDGVVIEDGEILG